MKNLLIGNGVNVQHGGADFGNAAIILRTLQSFKDPKFPSHIIIDDPIDAKSYIGYLFLEIPRMLSGKYDDYVNSTVEREALQEFKEKYCKYNSMKISDIGFEDYYLIHDLLCHRTRTINPDQYMVREAVKCSFLYAIYDDGKVNTAYKNYSEQFTQWIKEFDQIFTTNYDNNIEEATGKSVLHLHGDFINRSDVYLPDSFRNQLSDCPYDDYVIDENYSYLYSTALTTYSGNYKQYTMQESETANNVIEKMAKGYTESRTIQQDIDSWENDRNILINNLRESILLKINNPDLKFKEPYPIQPLRDMTGELIILGLSPFNDKHLFQIINKSRISKCIYYFYNDNEKEIISSLLPSINIEFKDARAFWGTKNSDTSVKHKKKSKRIIFRDISKSNFHKFAESYRALSFSIMTDTEIVRQFNSVPYEKRVQICAKIKELEVERERVFDQQFVLSVVDIHMIAAEFDIDPAVVCCIGVDKCKNEFYRLKK